MTLPQAIVQVTNEMAKALPSQSELEQDESYMSEQMSKTPKTKKQLKIKSRPTTSKPRGDGPAGGSSRASSRNMNRQKSNLSKSSKK